MPTVAALLLFTLIAPAGDGWSTGPLPAWVRPLEVPTPPADVPPPWTPRDFRVLLHDEQTDLRGPVVERFVHTADRLVDALDVQEQSHLELLFDPSYEQLVLHFVRLHRGGEVRELLDPARVSVIQREPDLDQLMYDGQRTLLFFPEGVARGDVIETAYTVRGSNPVFGEHALAELPLASGAGDVLLQQRVLTRADAEPRFAARGASVEPRTRTLPDGSRERTFERHLVPPVPYEDGAPAWADDLSWLSVSDFATWADVIAWGRPLYAVDAPPPETRELVRRFERVAPDTAGRVLVALRFVQDEVRYLGFELGPGSHRPRSPAEVLARRFGDCKDKSLLLVTLLRQLGVEAAPALVSTVLGAHLDDELPSPWAFDHVVVRARVDGRTCWLDATQLGERGPLAERATLPFGRALVLDDGERGLVALPDPVDATPDSVTTFDLGRVEPGRPTTLRWTSVSTREAANAMRRSLDWDGVDVLAADVADDLAALDPAVVLQGDPGVLDDESGNRVELSAAFRLRPQLVREAGRLELHLRAAGLERELQPPPAGDRRLPLAVPHPVHEVVEVRVRPPADFLAALDTGWMEPVRVEGPASVLERDGRRDGDGLALRWTFRSLADAVRPDDLDAQRAALAEMRALLAPVLAVEPRGHAGGPGSEDGARLASEPGATDPALADRPNWTVLACGALALLASLFAAAWSGARASTGARVVVGASVSAEARASGARGERRRPFLALGVLLAAGLPISQLVARRALFALPAWVAALASGGDGGHPARAPVLLLHLAGAIFLGFQGLCVAARLFRGRPGSVAAMTPVLMGLTALVWADALLLSWVGLGGNRIEAGMLTGFCGALSLFAHVRALASSDAAVAGAPHAGDAEGD
ncbi:MAG: DUF3857 domain-containing protein [Planctomycetes bacterium]|nr:DUF3857 domain-containing protein [Planctomycetota bacterium]